MVDDVKPFKVYTVAELMAMPEDFGPWGEWRFDPDVLVLVHDRWRYDVDLEEIDSSAEMLDWVFQIHRKGDMDVVGFLRGLNAVLYPQENYCSWGEDKRPSGSELAKAFAARMRAAKS